MSVLTLSATHRTLPAMLEHRAASDPDGPLLRTEDSTASAAEVLEKARASAARLLEAGVRAGDRVALLAANRAETLELWAGCSWIGAILVPIHASLRGPGLAHVLEDCAPRLLAVDEPRLAQLEALERLPATLERLWALDGSEAERLFGVPAQAPPASRHAAVPPPTASAEDTAALLYTSGTTGPAKGVCCPHAQFYWWGVNTARALAIEADDVLYTCLPLSHTNALNTFVQALLSGATYFLGPHFSASRFWQRLSDADASVTYILGAMVSILAGVAPGERDRRHRVRIALAPATPIELFGAFRERFGVELVDGHGMTETNLTIGPRDGQSRPGLMGRPMPGFEAQIVDEHDEPLPDGVAGELVLRSVEPYAFASGYWGAPETTVATWRNFWFHTGDRAVRESDGYFRFIDRIKDSMRRRGENISAWDVEQALLSHPDVAAAAAYPVPSELGEDEVMVSVVAREGATIDPSGLISHCEPLLARFAIPRYVRIASSLPLTENGKVQKFVLREQGLGEDTWDRESAGYEIGR